MTSPVVLNNDKMMVVTEKTTTIIFIFLKSFNILLTLEEYQTYTNIKSVKDFYYTITANFNGTDDFEAVTTETDTQNSQMPNMPNMTNNKGGMMGRFGNSVISKSRVIAMKPQ